MASGDGLGFVVEMADDWRVVDNRRRPKHSHVRRTDVKDDKKWPCLVRGEGAKLCGLVRRGVEVESIWSECITVHTVFGPPLPPPSSP
jgi:hypothetical protein